LAARGIVNALPVHTTYLTACAVAVTLGIDPTNLPPSLPYLRCAFTVPKVKTVQAMKRKSLRIRKRLSGRTSRKLVMHKHVCVSFMDAWGPSSLTLSIEKRQR
jgi:hypothetical protein